MMTIRAKYFVLVCFLVAGQTWCSPDNADEFRTCLLVRGKDQEKLAQTITSSVSQCVQSVVLLQQMGDGKTPEAVAQESGKMTEALGNMFYAFYVHGKYVRGYTVEDSELLAQACAREIIAALAIAPDSQ
jgi:hypothetical protein